MNDYCYIFAQVLNYHFRGLATAMLSLYLARKDYTLPKQSRIVIEQCIGEVDTRYY